MGGLFSKPVATPPGRSPLWCGSEAPVSWCTSAPSTLISWFFLAQKNVWNVDWILKDFLTLSLMHFFEINFLSLSGSEGREEEFGSSYLEVSQICLNLKAAAESGNRKRLQFESKYWSILSAFSFFDKCCMNACSTLVEWTRFFNEADLMNIIHIYHFIFYTITKCRL